MSFFLHESNDLLTLARRLADTLFAGNASADPFAEETVVVPDQGLARWLRLALADVTGFCPSLELPYPGAFLYRYVFNPMMNQPDAPCADEADLPFAPATVEWRIHKLLTRLEQEPIFDRVRTFTGDDAFRRWQLAGRLASLFDRYMTYRPDLLGEWERGNNPAEGEDAAWQARLWKELIDLDNGAVRHFSGLYQTFITTAEGQRPLPFLQPLFTKRRAYYFGISSLPPAHLDVLTRLARVDGFDLHFFTLNPCREEWSDARSLKAQLRDHATLVKTIGPQLASNYQTLSNPLLGSLGRSGRDFFSLLLAYDDIIEDRLFTEPEAPSILAAIQRNVLDNTIPATKQFPDPADRSLTVHACHSPMREVEVLHDQLLSLFRDLPGLAPRDVGVYLPDVETYAPYIDAVFGNTHPGMPGHIPYAIADKALAHTVDECQAFLSLLSVATSRFKASEVLGLLQNASIRERFRLSDQDVLLIGSLLKAANLAWGLDADFREQQGAAPTYANTWRFALDRIILGATMQDTSGEAAPLAFTEGLCIPLSEASESATVIGRLADFMAALAELHEYCTGQPERTCNEWREVLDDSLARFFTADNHASDGVIFMRKTFDQFTRFTTHADCGQFAIPFAVVRTWLSAQLGKPAGSERFVSGRVTFSRFVPMRNVPARVVGLLGMNDGAFPRNTPHLSFDLMDRRTGSRLGDRQTRDEDRYAFLEALLATRERLIITYTGQSEKDNKSLPPSVLVSELFDAADTAFTFQPSATECLTVKHPLHPFSPEYFRSDSDKIDPRLISFSKPYHNVATRLGIEPSPPPALNGDTSAIDPHVITLGDLVAFFRSPCKFFYTRKLDMWLDRRDDDLPDDEELLEPDTLDKYAIKDDLLDALEKDDAPDTTARLRERWQIEGRLPECSGSLVDETEPVIRKLLDKKAELHLGALHEKITFDIPLDNGIRLQGVLDALYESGALLFMRSADEKPKDIATAWIHHLAACASGHVVTTHGVYNKPRPYYAPFAPLSADDAHNILTPLTDIFIRGMRQPFCFDPVIGQKLADGKTPTEDDWVGSLYQKGVDTYMRRIFGDTLPEQDSAPWRMMEETAQSLFGSMPKPEKKRAKKK